MKLNLLLAAMSASFLFACNTSTTSNVENRDTTIVVEKGREPVSELPDEPSNIEVDTGASATPIEKDHIIYSDYPADNLPMEKLERQITNENQEIHVKIQNALQGDKLFVKTEAENKNGNIYISKVVLPDGNTDGPFGKEVTFTVKHGGDHLFIIKKNDRASGSAVGNILVTLKKL